MKFGLVIAYYPKDHYSTAMFTFDVYVWKKNFHYVCGGDYYR